MISTTLQLSHLSLTHPTTLTVGQCSVNHCFSATTVILNQEFGMWCEAAANERAVTGGWDVDPLTRSG